ncbi:MAG: signal peptidase I [Lachnospiraceae bacterium]|jgi:signal peptidase I|nr:signal peptidase I [Lachnospiraceae bacterium]MEE3461086.1 signal peptidase I [Lachnospiraceae bacterium]
MSREISLNEKRISPSTVRKIIISVIEAAIVIVLAYAVTHYGLLKMTVSDNNMDPTLKAGQNILIDRMHYKIRHIRRYDAVAIRQKGSGHTYYTVLRVIGLPGEKVKISDGNIYIDGNEKKDPLKFEKMKNGGLALDEIKLSDDEYFLLGDNRNNAMDSRNVTVGNITADNIMGKALVRTKPFAFVSRIDAFKD